MEVCLPSLYGQGVLCPSWVGKGKRATGQLARIGTALTQVRKEAFGLVGKLNKEQDSMLLGEGFEPAADGLWRRDGTYFGREAAMQKARSRMLQRGDYALYDLANRGEPRAEQDEAV
jgi:hypothetical protein